MKKNNIKNKQENMNNQDEGRLIKVEVADASGHQTLMLNLKKLRSLSVNKRYVDFCG